MALTCDINLEKYYKKPILKSWTYVNIGMARLKEIDKEYYNKLKGEQALIYPIIDEITNGMKKYAEFFGLISEEVEYYIKLFLDKFPLILNHWEESRFYDRWFIFFYILIKKYKPKLIIESGCNVGFSSTFIVLSIKENNNNCKFFTMDISLDFTWQKNKPLEYNRANSEIINKEIPALFVVSEDLAKVISYINGDSKEILPELIRENNEIDIFFHDSEHSYSHMVWECATVLPHIKQGGFLFVHDVGLNLAAFNDMAGNLPRIVLGDNLGVIKKTEDYKLNNKIKTFFTFSHSGENRNFFPKIITIQTRDNYWIEFDSEKEHKQKQELINYADFYKNLLDEYPFLFSAAEKIIFGENKYPLNRVNEIKKTMIGFLESFPKSDFVFYTDGLNLNQELIEVLSYPFGKYSYGTKNIIHFFLSASNNKLYFALNNSDDFGKVTDNLKKLLNSRWNPLEILVFLNFIIIDKNIEDLPAFVKFASQFNISGLICRYKNIETFDISRISNQEALFQTLEEAKKLAEKSGLKIELPFAPNQKKYARKDINGCHLPHLIFTPDKIFYTCGRIKNINNQIVFGRNEIDLSSSGQYKKLKVDFDNFMSKTCFDYCIKDNLIYG